MNLEFIDNILKKKLRENSQIVIYTYFELRVKYDLSKQDANTLLDKTKIKLENIGYRVYTTSETYIYNNHAQVVKENELLVAIKNEKIEREKKKK